MVQAAAQTPQIIERHLAESYNVTLINQDKFKVLTSKKGNVSTQDVDRHVFVNPIEEVGSARV